MRKTSESWSYIHRSVHRRTLNFLPSAHKVEFYYLSILTKLSIIVYADHLVQMNAPQYPKYGHSPFYPHRMSQLTRHIAELYSL